MLSSEQRRSGFSLTEVLVVLVILGLTVAALATTTLGPSPALQREAAMTALISNAAEVRSEAIMGGIALELQVAADGCQQNTHTLRFYPDGSAQPARICVGGADSPTRLYLVLDPYTAHLMREEDP